MWLPQLNCNSAATAFLLLHRRTGNRPIGTVYATVSGLWLKHLVTGFTCIEKLAGICWHHFFFTVPAVGAGDHGGILNFIHILSLFQAYGIACLSGCLNNSAGVYSGAIEGYRSHFLLIRSVYIKNTRQIFDLLINVCFTTRAGHAFYLQAQLLPYASFLFGS